jgi:3-hydroxyacyl-CoA dehydrogenase/enoyl-CoA hydratase/3-hydroxybutyryl-CoA epimerase
MTVETGPASRATVSGHALRVEVHDGIAVVTFATPGESVNIISRPVKNEFIALFQQLEGDPSIRGAVLISGKPDSFIAGADIEEFLDWKTAAQAESASREGHALLDRLESLRTPVVAAIHGACLGGGLEASLACAWRIATDHPKTVLALPEVQIGLIPGAGGTQRLPRTIGLQSALDMILTGKNVRAKKALQIGLVHELVHPSILLEIALQRARELADGTRKRNARTRPGGLRNFLLDENPVGRSVVFRKARQQVMERTQGNYPAPLAALDAVAASYQGTDHGFREEARLFGDMAMTPACRELIFLFFASSALKKDPGVAGTPAEPLAVERVGILGAGFMGAGIASVAVQQGTLVRLKDADLARVGKGLASVREVLKERLTKRQITRQELADTLLLASGTIDYTGFEAVDLVIEAVFEDLAVKQQVVREVEAIIPEYAIVATNTSTIPIARIAEASRRPERVLGMHFFSPVHKMPLLEVITTPATRPDVVTTAVSYGRKLGKTVIVVNDAPGFYVNRILAPYLNEAGALLDAGASIDAIDAALVSFGFPVGPITLLDEVGLDIAAKSGAIFHEAFGERMAPSQSMRAVVGSGRTGRKGHAGFYLYDESGTKGGVDSAVYALLPSGPSRSLVPPEEIQQRCVLALVNEAVRALEEGILRSPRDGDIGAVFGIGFPPFRGGPFRWIDSQGAATVIDALEDLSARFAPRFVPSDLLVLMARRGERFYPAEGRPVPSV